MINDDEDTAALINFSKMLDWDEVTPISTPVPTPWLDFSSWQPKSIKCTCGSEIAFGAVTTHSTWCDKGKR